VVQPDCVERLWKVVEAVRAFNYIDATSDAFLSRDRQFSKSFGELVAFAYFHLSPARSIRATWRNRRTIIEWSENRESFSYSDSESNF
jgi:hypothetical protein